MFDTKKLSDNEKESIHQWAADGADMAGVQQLLKSELGHHLTYMDTRFLALDLGLEFPSPKPEPEEEKSQTPVADSPIVDAGNAPGEPGAQDGFSLDVDQIARPGAVISGRVTFSDGEKALWLIDEMGRPSLDSDTPGYRPGEADLAKFQSALQEAIESGQA